MAQLVSLVQPADYRLDVQLTDALAVLDVSEPQPEDGVYRWEDDGGAVLPAVDLPA